MLVYSCDRCQTLIASKERFGDKTEHLNLSHGFNDRHGGSKSLDICSRCRRDLYNWWYFQNVSTKPEKSLDIGTFEVPK